MVPVSEQRSRVLILVNSCVHILYGVSTMILVTFAVGLISHETHTDNGIQKNWETTMITDIQSSRYDSCPAGYEPMFGFDWPGTFKSCNCLLWDENPLGPHGPDGEYTQKSAQNFDYLPKTEGSKSKDSKQEKYFIKTKLERNYKSDDSIDLEESDVTEQEGGNSKRQSDYKKQIKHKQNNKSQENKEYDEEDSRYNYNNNNGRETKEDVMKRLQKYGQENKIYTEGLCNWNQTQAGCYDIQANKPLQFSKWKQRLQWCVQRAQAVSMINMYKYYDPVKGECNDENLRVCGDPEDKNYQYCFPKTYVACPINGILITTTQPRGQEAYYYNSHPMQFSRNQMLYVSRVIPKSLPIQSFVVSEDGVCIEDSKANISENHGEYFLLNKHRNRCGNSTDERFQLVDQQGEHSFYFNNFALNLRDTLPNFSLNNTYQYGLYKHHYIQWKHECAENMGYFLSDTIFDQFYTREKTLKIITYLVSTLTILITVVEMLLICKIPFILNLEKFLLQWNPCIQIALSLIVLPFCAAALHQAIVLTNLENMLQTKQCSDEFTLKLISSGSVVIHQKISNFNKGQIIFICLLLLVNAVNFLLTLCCNSTGQSNTKKKRRASTY